MSEHTCCGRDMEPVYQMRRKGDSVYRFLRGWWCRKCRKWEQAIGREHRL